MYQANTYYPNTYNGYNTNTNLGYNYSKNDDRLIGGGFLGPFVLGGITGGLVSPYFYRPYSYPRPPMGPYPYYPRYW